MIRPSSGPCEKCGVFQKEHGFKPVLFVFHGRWFCYDCYGEVTYAARKYAGRRGRLYR